MLASIKSRVSHCKAQMMIQEQNANNVTSKLFGKFKIVMFMKP